MSTSNLLEWWEKSGRFGLIGVGLGLVILGGWWMLSDFQSQGGDIEFFEIEQEEKTDQVAQLELNLIVDVRGGVKRPGVYELSSDSRLHQAVTAAGGLSIEADVEWVEKNLNMARKIIDGEKIYIPTEKDNSENTQFSSSNLQIDESSHRGVSVSDSSDGVLGESQQLVNINTAGQSELETLPGIGPSFAQRIIDYRNEHGGFKSIEEIQAVSGIGEKTFENIKNRISI